MIRTLLAAVLGLSSFAWQSLPTASAAEWRPAAGPLSTRWSADVSADNPLADYPRPQMVRKNWKSLNGLWQLEITGDDKAAPPVGHDLPDQILVPFPVESALSGVMKPATRLWYRRQLEIPADWKGQRVLLNFGAVDWEATVWLNGQRLGEHRGGYDAFSFDVTDALADSGPNELIVGVFDPSSDGRQPRGKQVRHPEGIYYTPTTGIWQTVWLEPVAETHIETVLIEPDVDKGLVRVTVGASQAAGASVQLQARDGATAVANAEGRVGEPIELPIKDPKLWSPESPFLYELTVSLVAGERAVDSVDSYFGLRKIAVVPDEKGTPRIELNGKPMFLTGPLDQGFWPDGLYTAPTDEALKYDIEMTKRLGFNMTRKHVKVEPERWYYWCDKLGLLVWQDMPSGDRSVRPGAGEIERTADSASQYELVLERMIRGRRNHPAIIMWVVFNEGWGQYDTVRITNWVKKLDPSRLANPASGWNDFPAGDVIDLHAYPGPGAPKPDGKRALVLGEFGGLGLGVDGHTWAKKTWGYRGTASREDLTARYAALWRAAWRLRETAGLNAAVYTQITDVETEANGLMTYDRAVLKVDLERARAAAQGNVPQLRPVLPTSEQEPQTWRYRFTAPPEGWFARDFEAADWQKGPGGFGTQGTPGAVVRTEWKTPEIWLRRQFALTSAKPDEIELIVHHDEDVEVYINGVLAAKAEGYTTSYEELPISAEARATLKPNGNVIAVHCRQTRGGQYIDVGVAELLPSAPR